MRTLFYFSHRPLSLTGATRRSAERVRAKCRNRPIASDPTECVCEHPKSPEMGRHGPLRAPRDANSESIDDSPATFALKQRQQRGRCSLPTLTAVSPPATQNAREITFGEYRNEAETDVSLTNVRAATWLAILHSGIVPRLDEPAAQYHIGRTTAVSKSPCALASMRAAAAHPAAMSLDVRAGPAERTLSIKRSKSARS